MEMAENTIQPFVSGVVNYKGEPAMRATTGGWNSASLIVGIEACERMATMAILTDMVTYLVRTMHLPSATASNATTNFGGVSYLLCLIGGIIADSFLHRYWMIIISAFISALGTCLLAIATTVRQLQPPSCDLALPETCQEANSLQMVVFYSAVYLYAIGLGGIKSSVSAFGADQFDPSDDHEKIKVKDFFNRFFVIINMGSILAVTVLVYVEYHVGGNWGFGSCSVAMMIASFVFMLGTKKYRYKKREGSAIIQIIQVLVAASLKQKLALPCCHNDLYQDNSQNSRHIHTNKLRVLDKAAIATEEDQGIGKPGITLNPWRLCTVTRIENVKMMSGLLPIVATTIIAWTVYAQMASFSVQQASTMDRHLGKQFEIPPGSYNVFVIGSIMGTLSIYDCLIMPLFRKSRKPQGLTNLQKIGIGLFSEVMGMVAAATVEGKRLSIAKGVLKGCVVPMSAFWLLPQFILVGMGNALISAGQLDFFITESPEGMKAIGNGLFLTTTSLGMFSSSILVEIMKKVTGRNGSRNWLPRHINHGRLDYFYALLGVLGLINLGLFIVCARKYRVNGKEGEENVDGESNVQIHPKNECV